MVFTVDSSDIQLYNHLGCKDLKCKLRYLHIYISSISTGAGFLLTVSLTQTNTHDIAIGPAQT